MEKRGQTKVIVVILLILMILALIIILWNILFPFIGKNLEITEIKADLVRVKMDIDNIDVSEKSVNITLSRGPERVVLANITNVPVYINVSFVSVFDLSGSMTAFSKFTNAKIANKDFIEKVFSEINFSHEVGLAGYKGVSELASGDIHSLASNDLTNNLSMISLFNVIDNNWIANGGTCISCGIIKARELLESSDNPRVMIVMSDGEAISKYDPLFEGNAKEEAIEQAKLAYEESNIKVYSIGFGDLSNPLAIPDEATLQSIASEGGGEYSFADIDEISDIYQQTATEIIRNYKAEQKWDHLKIIFRNSTTSWAYDHYELPAPLETRVYEVPESVKLDDYIVNLTHIDIFMAVYTEDGSEVLSQLLSSYEVQ